MIKIFTLIGALTISYFASAQDDHAGHNHAVTSVKQEAKAAPEVLSLKQTDHDFGKIPQGKPVTYEFTFTNTGSTGPGGVMIGNLPAGGQISVSVTGDSTSNSDKFEYSLQVRTTTEVVE